MNLELNLIDYVVYTILFILLFLCSLEDIKYKKIYVKKVNISFILLIPSIFFRTNITILECLIGAMIGVIFLVISKITKGQVGSGDGFVLCVTGLGLGIIKSMEMLLCGLVLAALFSAVLLVKKRGNKKMTIPFVPFLFIGYVIGVIVPR